MIFPHVRSLNPPPAEIVVQRSTPQFEARRKTIDRAAQPYSLVLDDDTKIPNKFLTPAHEKLLEGHLACTLNYCPDIQKHPPFGASLWVTDTLKEVYDYQVYVQNYKPIYEKTEDTQGNTHYKITNPILCECRYMWSKLKPSELYIFEDLTAVHLKSVRR
jgi:hypothetical protein